MSTRITDITGERVFEIVADDERLPDSVWLSEVGGVGLCIEFSRRAVENVIRDEFRMFESVDTGLMRVFGIMA